MVYHQLVRSWEAEMKAGNLLSALELIKTQLSTNIVRFLNQFRENPFDEDTGVYILQIGVYLMRMKSKVL